MEKIRTVKYFVSGSYKYFDIFKCTVDEVDESTDSRDRKTIVIKVGDETFTGLHNAKVYDFLCEEEGSESFVVLWKSFKGDYMLAYSWFIWENEINNSHREEVDDAPPALEGESFVYMWIDYSNGKKYIGKHKGSIDDGYICSSETVMRLYKERPRDFYRTILAYGTEEEMTVLETILLLQLKATKSPLYYNLSNNLRK